MKVLKFGGTSVGSAKRIKEVAALVTPRGNNIIVLSAMSGTTNTLVEIAEYLYRHNVNGAKATINSLEKKYTEVIAELYDKEATREAATAAVGDVFRFLRTFAHEGEFTSVQEKEILAQGELISTTLMHLYMQGQGTASGTRIHAYRCRRRG